MKTKNQIKQELQYDKPYHWFLNRANEDGSIYYSYLFMCLDFIKDADLNNVKILDAGCGDGRFCQYLKDLGCKHVIGVDYSDKALSFSRLLVNDVSFYRNDLSSLQFDNNSFDFIFLIETLEHIELNKVDIVINELFRVLKPGGRVVVTVPSDLIPVNKKHFQHFNYLKIETLFKNKFSKIEIKGNRKRGIFSFSFFYKFVDNSFYNIKPISKLLNLYYRQKFDNNVNYLTSERLIVFLQKK